MTSILRRGVGSQSGGGGGRREEGKTEMLSDVGRVLRG